MFSQLQPVVLLSKSIVSVFKGRTHSEDAAKSGQEDCASSGVEENASGPKSHSWTSTAARRESPDSSGPGKKKKHCSVAEKLLGSL